MASNPQITVSNKQTRFNEKNRNMTNNNQQRYRRNDNRNRNYVPTGNIQRGNNSSFLQPSSGSTVQHTVIFENKKINPQNNKVINDIKDPLRCQICVDILQIPVYICDNGHDICKFCTLQYCTLKCHICGFPYSKTRRNKTVEDIIEMLTVPCQNSSLGCPYRNFEDMLKTHICDFRELICPCGKYDQNCNWTGNIASLEMHFSQVHVMNFTLTPGKEILFKNFNVFKNDKNLQLIKVKESLFIYHVKIDLENSVGNWVIQYIGSEQDAEEWIYEFSFYSKISKSWIRTMESCKSHNVDVNKLFFTGHCVSIPLNVLSQLLDRKGDFSFKFFIKYQPVKKNKGLNDCKGNSGNTIQNCVVQNLIDLDGSSNFTNEITPQNSQPNNVDNNYSVTQDLMSSFDTSLTEQAALLEALQLNNTADVAPTNENNLHFTSTLPNTTQPTQDRMPTTSVISSASNISTSSYTYPNSRYSVRNTPLRNVTHSSVSHTRDHPLESQSNQFSQNNTHITTNSSTFVSSHTTATYSRPITRPTPVVSTTYTRVYNPYQESTRSNATNAAPTYGGSQRNARNIPVAQQQNKDCLIL